MAAPFLGERGINGGREGAAKAAVAEQISQAVKTTANLLQLTEKSSPAKTDLMKCPKNLLAKTSTINNTKLMIQQMPRAVSFLDAHIEHGLQSIPHLRAVAQLLEEIGNCQLTGLLQEKHIHIVASYVPGTRFLVCYYSEVHPPSEHPSVQ